MTNGGFRPHDLQVEGHWVLPRGGRETCPGDGHGICPVRAIGSAKLLGITCPGWSTQRAYSDRRGLWTCARFRRSCDRRVGGVGAGSAVAVARVFGISSSNAAGYRLDEMVTERFSQAASTRRYSPSAASWATYNRPCQTWKHGE